MSHEITNKFKRQKRLLFLKRSLFVFSLFLFVVVGLLFFMNKAFKVSEVKVTGARGKLSEEADKYAQNFFNERVFPFVERSAVFWDANVVEERLKKEFPAIYSASLNRNFYEKLALIEVEERIPWAVWCRTKMEEDNEECFYIDETGVLFGRAPRFSEGIIFTIKDIRPKDFILGDKIISERTLENLQSFIARLKEEKNEEVGAVEISEGPAFLLYLKDLAVKTDAETDMERAFENFGLITESIPAKDLESINYIDLRFKDKVFYK